MMKTDRSFLISVCSLLFLIFFAPAVHAELVIWANNGEDKITQDELRANTDASDVVNVVWDGSKITISGAKNEVVAFNLVLESADTQATDVTVEFNTLTGPGNTMIASKKATRNTLFDWTDRHIELFYIRYLEIKGLSILSYDALYDERHVPKRFQRPWTGDGEATGTWEDREDHNKLYPDIAVPLELESPFEIAADTNQSIWVDIYIPKNSAPGTYTGTVTINHNEGGSRFIPVELIVLNFSLPDLPEAKSMLIFSPENINDRYLGQSWIYEGDPLYQTSLLLADRHFQVAHRHKISLIGNVDGYTPATQMNEIWLDRLNGDLFEAVNGYDGPGIGTGNNVYAIGEYGQWPWQSGDEADMWQNTDAWVQWFDNASLTTPTEYFLYLIDESDNYPQIQEWAQWIHNNPGPGNRLKSFATLDLPEAAQHTPSLDIPASWAGIGITEDWQNACDSYVQNSRKRFYLYNGNRPASGSFCIEDDGVALRVNGWIQYKKQIDRWFFWESTYYDNYQGGTGQTDVFNQAFTYGTNDGIDLEYALGESGWNYTNGDGVLFYPGTDTHYPGSNYGIEGPFASLRLKYWRRGIQDADYLALASEVDKTATDRIVERMIPKVLWDYGVENPEDPTFVYTDISWSIDPDDWEAARKELADIISGGAGEPVFGTSILTDSFPNITIPTGSNIFIYGTAAPNSIIIENGAKAELLNFPGQNTIQVQAGSDLFHVSRSGSVVSFQGSDGTFLKVPATASVQTISFNGEQSRVLQIHNNQVMLDDQVITLNRAPIETN